MFIAMKYFSFTLDEENNEWIFKMFEKRKCERIFK